MTTNSSNQLTTTFGYLGVRKKEYLYLKYCHSLLGCRNVHNIPKYPRGHAKVLKISRLSTGKILYCFLKKAWRGPLPPLHFRMDGEWPLSQTKISAFFQRPPLQQDWLKSTDSISWAASTYKMSGALLSPQKTGWSSSFIPPPSPSSATVTCWETGRPTRWDYTACRPKAMPHKTTPHRRSAGSLTTEKFSYSSYKIDAHYPLCKC